MIMLTWLWFLLTPPKLTTLGQISAAPISTEKYFQDGGRSNPHSPQVRNLEHYPVHQVWAFLEALTKPPGNLQILSVKAVLHYKKDKATLSPRFGKRLPRVFTLQREIMCSNYRLYITCVSEKLIQFIPRLLWSVSSDGWISSVLTVTTLGRVILSFFPPLSPSIYLFHLQGPHWTNLLLYNHLC